MEQLIKALAVLTVVIAFGPMLLFVDVQERREAVQTPKITAQEIQNLNEDSIMSLMASDRGVSPHQRMLLTQRLTMIHKQDQQKSIEEIRASCIACNENLSKMNDRLGKAEEVAATERSAEKSKNKWVFFITFIGALVLLGFKLNECLKQKNEKKRTSATIILLVEWIFPAIVLVITNPWMG